jgi:tRNA U38,U39,U40 pseudouridine synthase TruA
VFFNCALRKQPETQHDKENSTSTAKQDILDVAFDQFALDELIIYVQEYKQELESPRVVANSTSSLKSSPNDRVSLKSKHLRMIRAMEESIMAQNKTKLLRFASDRYKKILRKNRLHARLNTYNELKNLEDQFEDIETIKTFRLSALHRKELDEICAHFVGVRDYHNFTRRSCLNEKRLNLRSTAVPLSTTNAGFDTMRQIFSFGIEDIFIKDEVVRSCA